MTYTSSCLNCMIKNGLKVNTNYVIAQVISLDKINRVVKPSIRVSDINSLTTVTCQFTYSLRSLHYSTGLFIVTTTTRFFAHPPFSYVL
jgi:hypothetical protein